MESDRFHPFVAREDSMEEETIRKQIVVRHDRRLEQLEKLIAEREDKLKEHDTRKLKGGGLLSQEEHDLATKQVHLYQKKVEEMNSLKDSDMDRMISREQRRVEMMDY